MASEIDAIDELIRAGQMPTEVGNIMKQVASSTDMPPLEDFEGERFYALYVLIDKSGSIKESGLTNAVIEGQHHMLDSLLGASSDFEIHLGQILFDENVHLFQKIVPFRRYETEGKRKWEISPEVIPLNETNYRPKGGTSLYDAILTGICGMVRKWLEVHQTGTTFHAKVAVLTDGKDEGPGSKVRPDALRKVVEYALSKNCIQTLVLAGVGNYDYHAIAKQIGATVIECTADAKSIRHTFGLFSSIPKSAEGKL